MRLIFFAVILSVLGLAAYTWMVARFDRYARTLMNQVRGDTTVSVPSAVETTQLPAVVRRYFAGTGVALNAQPRNVHLAQSAELRMGPHKPWKALRCEQVIAISKPGFAWYAVQLFGPFTVIRILDAYVTGHGYLHARLFGSLPVADESGPDLDRSELMRYLAEVPWVPDAVLYNDALQWRTIDDNVVELTADSNGGVAQVRLYFNELGDIVEMQADERDCIENGAIVARPWRGVYSEHREMGGRRIPTHAEVGYVYEDGYAAYWRGDITDYRVE